ncbi:hypothetical protein IC229_20685 [Spirosoma sp. BT702]|uniref:RHS repeat protein n=1 Tax=Spirosoma profusum TaxID=2771354 RepID=A0A927ARZ8_9BACT|nr:hypothetical protein [Spirosoma profusum]MBD2703076.1 hypothetical protein [Spirosoma profusum]
MKKLQFQGKRLHSLPTESRKHAAILVYILIVLLGELLIQACQHRVGPTNEPGSIGHPSNDSIISKPGNSDGPDGQVGVFKTLKIARTDTDYQMIQFDAARKPVQYVNQHVVDQETGAVRRSTYQFLHGLDGRLYRVNTVGGGYVVYLYGDNAGGPVLSTEEYDGKGEPLVLRAYSYSGDNRLIAIDQRRDDGSPPTRRTYQYDSRGNLSLISDFVMDTQFRYVLETTTSFEDYDNGIQVENLLAEFPFLPGVTFHRNNFCTKVIRYKDGREISRETATYTYNKQGLPTQKVSRVRAGTLTTTYTY